MKLSELKINENTNFGDINHIIGITGDVDNSVFKGLTPRDIRRIYPGIDRDGPNGYQENARFLSQVVSKI